MKPSPSRTGAVVCWSECFPVLCLLSQASVMNHLLSTDLSSP